MGGDGAARNRGRSDERSDDPPSGGRTGERERLRPRGGVRGPRREPAARCGAGDAAAGAG
ncbi:hypothetical protein CVT30_06180 [Streptomyces sp. AMCC400023]|nr:hypothetical protein CVT30_06180 [Streptomyces sp. AMCC400023]